MTLAAGKDDANKHLELGKQMLSSGNLLDALSHFDSAVGKYCQIKVNPLYKYGGLFH